MGFLDWLNNLFKGSNQNSQVTDLQNKLNSCLSSGQSYQAQIATLQETIKEMQTGDTSQRPSFLGDGYVYSPNIVTLYWKGNLTDPRDIYNDADSLDNLVLTQGWLQLAYDQKLIAVWVYVMNLLTYQFLNGDWWQPPIFTYYSKIGDCEDGTILMTQLWKLVGIPADSCFNACGYFVESDGTKAGHSFPIAKMSDGKWYIFESTIHPADTTTPMLFKGSNYTAEWGLCNWKFYGALTPVNGMYQL